MTKIYALLNPDNKIVDVGLSLGQVTNFLDHSFSPVIWDALFGEEDPHKREKLLEQAGWKIKTSIFESKKGSPKTPLFQS